MVLVFLFTFGLHHLLIYIVGRAMCANCSRILKAKKKLHKTHSKKNYNRDCNHNLTERLYFSFAL
jgi:hypothetical protein